MVANLETSVTITNPWESEAQAMSDFLRGSFDVGYGALIGFDPHAADGERWSIVQHQGPRFGGGDVRMGWGSSFEAALLDVAQAAWGPGIQIVEAMR